MDQQKDTTEQEIAEQVKALLALAPDQRRAIVAACTVVIEAFTQRDTVIIVVRSDIGNGSFVRTHAWGTDGSADAADILANTAQNIAAQEAGSHGEVLQ